jgi:tRNA modification GTPase
VPLHLVDTAGLRDSSDAIEQEGVRRARAELESADHILWVYDDELDPDHAALDRNTLPPHSAITLVRNKIDLTAEEPTVQDSPAGPLISISARTGAGLDLLRAQLRQSLGLHDSREGEFIARRRHLDALQRAADALTEGERILQQTAAGELVAEELRQAQQALSEITGEFTPDDLLDRIFSDFCIGK